MRTSLFPGLVTNLISNAKRGNVIIECDKNYFRPLDANTLLGDARKAKKKLKWKPVENINSLIDEMIESEYQYLNADK